MAMLDEVRELLADGDQRWSTLRAEGRSWENVQLARSPRGVAPAFARGTQGTGAGKETTADGGFGPGGAARAAARAQANERVSAVRAAILARKGATRGVRSSPEPSRAVQRDAPVPVERDERWKLWRGGPALLRSEWGSAEERITIVAQGPRWWRHSTSSGSTSGMEPRSVVLLLGPPLLLAEGARIASVMELVEVAPVQFLSRPCFVVRATPGDGRGASAVLLARLGAGADEYQLVVDAERGVVLSLTAFVDGRAFRLVETTAIAFDEELSPSVFTPVGVPTGSANDPTIGTAGASPASSSRNGAGLARNDRRISLADLASSVPYTVFVPVDPRLSGEPFVTVVDLGPQQATSRRGMLTYRLGTDSGGRGTLRIQLSGAVMASRSVDTWRSAGECEVCETHVAGTTRTRIRLRKASTYVELESTVLGVDDLVILARSLTAVPRS